MNENRKLGEATHKAMRQKRMSIKALAAEAQVSESWVKQMRGGRIARPEAAKLVRMAMALGEEPNRFLALADQLGAPQSVVEGPVPGDLADAIRELTTELRAIRDERAEYEARLRAVEAELESLRARPTGGASARRRVPPETTGSAR